MYNPYYFCFFSILYAYLIHVHNLEVFFILDEYECGSARHQCDLHADCLNTYGSYRCLCQIGYEGDGFTCNLISKSPVHMIT